MRIRMITAVITILLAFSCGGCVNQDSALAKEAIDWSTPKQSEITGLDYEENSTGYKAALLSFEDEAFIIEEVQAWAAEKTAADSYRAYIYSDPDSWEMYVYHTSEGGGINYDSMRFYIEDSTVKLFLTSSDAVDDGQGASYFLVVVQAPVRGPWPSQSEVYVDDVPLDNELLDASM